MNKVASLVTAPVVVIVGSLSAQRDTGGLPQTVQWGMEQAMPDLEARSLGITQEAMIGEVGAETMQAFAVTDEGDWQDPGVVRSEYSVPKNPQELTLTFDARGREVKVARYNKFGKAESAVTYYVGPLKGLFCMGLADEGIG